MSWRLTLLAGLLGLLCCLPVAAAEEPSAPLLLVHGAPGEAEPMVRRKALQLLAREGAGRFAPGQLTLWTELLPDDVGGAAPQLRCPDGQPQRAAASLAAELDAALLAVQYGRNQSALHTLASLAAALPCAGEPLDDGLLARLWFLTGAVQFLEGRSAESRDGFLRAALVDFSVGFDELFPATVHDSLLAAKNTVLERPLASIVVFADAEVRLDGRLVPLRDGVGRVEARVGPRLLQVTSGGRTTSVVVDLAALPPRRGVSSAVVVDTEGLAAALTQLEGPDSASAETARAAVLGLLAARGDPYGLLVASRPRERRERALTELDLITAQIGPYTPRNSRADVFGRRARIAVAPFYRALSRPRESGLHYGGVEVVGWIPVHWLVRAGFGARWAITPRPPPDGKAVCCSTFEVSPRLRLERGDGLFRPFGELGFLLFWPAASHEGSPPGPLDVAAGFDVGGGLMVTPGEQRRFGVALSGFGGAIAGIGPKLELRASIELRF